MIEISLLGPLEVRRDGVLIDVPSGKSTEVLARLAVDTRANVLPVYDSTAIHARAAVEWMLAEEEQARAAA